MLHAHVAARSLALACALLALAACPEGPREASSRDAEQPGVDAGADVGVGRLDPRSIPQFEQPLVIPPAMPFESRDGGVTEYAIAARQFEQQVLPRPLPMTTVWGYGRASDPLPGGAAPSTFNYPGYTIEARANERVRVRWVNGLVDSAGRFRPHLLSVDANLHWADPSGMGSPGEMPTEAQELYRGPVPLVTHVHGAHVADHSDGHPDAWFLPDATDVPEGFAMVGRRYRSRVLPKPGEAVYEYTNDQRASTLWYHDHALGITRLNVYAGLAGFWILRDGEEDALGLPGPAPRVGDAAGTVYREIPLAIQDRSFNADGSLFYPDSRALFDDYDGPYVPETEVPPYWNPEFFGDAIVVNGRVWPYHEVEPRQYRLRLLNGCNSRFLILAFDRPGLAFQQIGAEGGLLPAVATTERLLVAPGERADVLVDFSALPAGAEAVMLNLGPDEPYPGPRAVDGPGPADPETTGRVMKFKVLGGTPTPGSLPASLPAIAPLVADAPPRQVTLNEAMDMHADIPVAAFLGTAGKGPLRWADEVTERPQLGATEVWEVVNLTADAHPIHLHLVSFQVLDRRPFDHEEYAEAQRRFLAHQGPEPQLSDFFEGEPIPPEPGERGWKDTVIAAHGEVTRLVARFDLAGLYLWHCHILEHEDNEMMRPFEVWAP